MATDKAKPRKGSWSRSAEFRSVVCAHLASARIGTTTKMADGTDAQVIFCEITELSMGDFDESSFSTDVEGRFREELGNEEMATERGLARKGAFRGEIRVKGSSEKAFAPNELSLEVDVIWTVNEKVK